MVIEDIKVPDIGDFENVDVIEVLVSAGDRVGQEDPLITLESDKATMDVPSPMNGIVKEVKVKVGDKVSQGSVILSLETQDAGQQSAQSEASEKTQTQPIPRQQAASQKQPQKSASQKSGDIHAEVLARSTAWNTSRRSG